MTVVAPSDARPGRREPAQPGAPVGIESDTTPAPRPAPVGKPPWWQRVIGSAWFHLLAALVLTALVLSFVAKPYWVTSGSMEQTLQPGDRVMVNRVAYLGGAPGSGDIIVFDAGDAWDPIFRADPGPLRAVLEWLGQATGFGPSGPHTLVKRIIGTPGQTIECCSADGELLVDGRPIDEPYVSNDFPFDPGELDCTTEPRSSRCLDAVDVPDGHYLVLGDNRAASSDSASACRRDESDDDCWRWAAREDIVGTTVFVFWPLGRIGVP